MPSLSFLARASLSVLLLMAMTPAAASSNLFLGGDATPSNPHESPLDIRNRVKETRIVGGEKAQGGRYPYAFPLGDSAQFCGGSLIAPNAVLTAAHCMDGEKLEDMYVWVGSDEIDGGTKMGFKAGYEHPDYDSNTDEYDLYVLILDGEVNDIPPVRVNPNPNWPVSGMTATTMGWGVLKEDGKSPEELMRVEVEVISNKECEEYEEGGDNYGGWIYDDMVCTNTPGKDACQGDSGGAVIIESDDGNPANDVVFGIVSWGIGCARMPGVYARPSAAYEWIVRMVCEENDGTGDLCGVPTPEPTTASPTKNPTAFPTQSPTKRPTTIPTRSPTRHPTKYPTRSPTIRPTLSPTSMPSGTPSITTQPSSSPSGMPSSQPSSAPSSLPTSSSAPSDHPTTTSAPTSSPSATPSISALPTSSQQPSSMPSAIPSSSPSRSALPSSMPSGMPSSLPSSAPSISFAPTLSSRPTISKPPSPAVVSLGSSVALDQSVLSEEDASSSMKGQCITVRVLLGGVVAAWLMA